jgi:hypothetical protein
VRWIDGDGAGDAREMNGKEETPESTKQSAEVRSIVSY